MTRQDRIASLLTTAFAPTRLEILDDSAKHAHHAGMKGLPPGETHYSITIIAPHFNGLSRIARSRAVHETLATEFTSGLHALALTLKTPEEMA